MATMQDCIKDCLDCHAVCLATVSHCLRKGGEHAAPDHIRMLQDCAQICSTSADFMLRASPLHQMTCRICAGICEMCADDCTQVRRRRGDGAVRRGLPALRQELRRDGRSRPQGSLAAASA